MELKRKVQYNGYVTYEPLRLSGRIESYSYLRMDGDISNFFQKTLQPIFIEFVVDA